MLILLTCLWQKNHLLGHSQPTLKKHKQRQLQANCSAAEMATENVFAGEKQNVFTIEQIYHCSSDITAGIHGQLTFLSALNSFLSIMAFLGNALILVALRKESSLNPPSKHLLRCLATTDLWTLEPLSLRSSLTCCSQLYLVCVVSVDTDCDKRGQTSRPVDRAEIQTSCDTETSLLDNYYLLIALCPQPVHQWPSFGILLWCYGSSG